MKSIIITPLYYIDNKLMSVIKETAGQGPVTFIITDDVSPIFPVENRIEWLTKTLIGVEFPITFEIESMAQNDENEEFYDALIKRLDALRESGEELDITIHLMCARNIYTQYSLHDLVTNLLSLLNLK
jgi:hypothetical protein